MPRLHAFIKADVFTTTPFEGNPLAVFTDGRGLDTAMMQRIACELNLSETTFVFPPDDPQHAARVRIFTPRSELAFAGHPTVGTAFVVRGDAPLERLVLEEGVGAVPVRVVTADDGALQFYFTAPPATLGDTVDPAPVARALGLEPIDLRSDAPPQIVDAGNAFLYVCLRDRESVDRIELLDHRALRAALPNAPLGVFVFAPLEESDGEPGDTYAVYSRMFAPDQGIAEDPATGSATGSLPVYLIRHGLIPLEDGLRFVSEQGTKMGRRSILHVIVHVGADDVPSIEVGGSVVAIARGEMLV